ncbi:hypothetical protein Stube_30150 [Streptomyces tubercidicus]|uniref:Formamidopyrimidine-DNA glycosylase catalytic domain-containing protein n=1 Tax=Streptomyces tubercidicus TaxID=47759 RepID=A0A640USH1_9ACTN|nr:hypothetical protein Stube_30150 [Streptomyces tubercidicus]
MPELPDVEAFRAILASCAQGRRIQRTEVYDAGVLHGVSAGRLRRELTGRRFAEPERRGKWLLARTDGPTVLLHFGMTGELVCANASDPVHAHDRVVFTVDGGQQLRYRDQRKLQGLWLVDEAGLDRMLREQGPDAAELTRTAFAAVLAGRRGTLKSLLMDQSALAVSAISSSTRSCGAPGCTPPGGPTHSPTTSRTGCTPRCAAPCVPRYARAAYRRAVPGSRGAATPPRRPARAAARPCPGNVWRAAARCGAPAASPPTPPGMPALTEAMPDLPAVARLPPLAAHRSPPTARRPSPAASVRPRAPGGVRSTRKTGPCSLLRAARRF